MVANINVPELTMRQTRRLVEMYDQIAQLYEDAGAAQHSLATRTMARALQASLPHDQRRWKRLTLKKKRAA